VVQGVQILASKSKVVPTRVSRKSKFTSHFWLSFSSISNSFSVKETLEQSISTISNIIRLYSHELMRVFSDRMFNSSGKCSFNRYFP
jgi:hypothetical protein